MDLRQQKLLRNLRHAGNYARKLIKLDSVGMLRLSQSLRGSFAARRALARGLFIASMAIALSCATTLKAEAKPYNIMNVKLYAYNKLTWDEFQCYNWLIYEESRWNYLAKNGSHYGLGQMRSKWYGTLNPYEQIDAHLIYVNHRYGNACKAYEHWEKYRWH